MIRCSECGCSLTPSTTIYKGKSYFYYACRKRYHNGGSRDCPNRKSFMAVDTEGDVWGAVSSALLDPETLARDLQEFIEREQQTRPGDPRDELKAFSEELEKIDRRRGGFLDLAADSLMNRDELRTKLAELEERREVVRREMDALAARRDAWRNWSAIRKNSSNTTQPWPLQASRSSPVKRGLGSTKHSGSTYGLIPMGPWR